MVPRIKVLNDSEILEIDRASHELLCEVGIKVEHDEALEIF
jgi:trimethylamine:corrinoid methyltransferase-like protein